MTLPHFCTLSVVPQDWPVRFEIAKAPDTEALGNQCVVRPEK
jgi:hypothetical protein